MAGLKGTIVTPPEERVPIRFIAPLIERWMLEYSADHDESASGADQKYARTDRGHEGSISILAFHSGVSSRWLRMIRKHTFYIGDSRNGTKRFVDWVPFNTADRIVCATVSPWAWHQEPLKRFYGPLPVRGWERGLEAAA